MLGMNVTPSRNGKSSNFSYVLIIGLVNLLLYISTSSALSWENSLMKLRCNVVGDVSLVSADFESRLCTRAARALDAKLIDDRGFRQALKARDDTILAQLEVSIKDKMGIEYTFTKATAREWVQRPDRKGVIYAIDVMDKPLSDAVIDKLVGDLDRIG